MVNFKPPSYIHLHLNFFYDTQSNEVVKPQQSNDILLQSWASVKQIYMYEGAWHLFIYNIENSKIKQPHILASKQTTYPFRSKQFTISL